MKKLLTIILMLGLLTLPVLSEETKPILKPNENCIKQLEKGEFCAIYCIGGIKFILTSGGSFFPLTKLIDSKESSISCDCSDSI